MRSQNRGNFSKASQTGTEPEPNHVYGRCACGFPLKSAGTLKRHHLLSAGSSEEQSEDDGESAAFSSRCLHWCPFVPVSFLDLFLGSVIWRHPFGFLLSNLKYLKHTRRALKREHQTNSEPSVHVGHMAARNTGSRRPSFGLSKSPSPISRPSRFERSEASLRANQTLNEWRLKRFAPCDCKPWPAEEAPSCKLENAPSGWLVYFRVLKVCSFWFPNTKHKTRGTNSEETFVALLPAHLYGFSEPIGAPSKKASRSFLRGAFASPQKQTTETSISGCVQLVLCPVRKGSQLEPLAHGAS